MISQNAILGAICILASMSQILSFTGPFRAIVRQQSSSSSIYMAGFGAKKEVVDASKTTARVADAAAPCACGSGAVYGQCCQPYHNGKATPENPVKMVRSRYSALVYKVIPYLMATTHPKHKEFVDLDQKGKRKMWERDLKTFADDYNFVSLEFNNESADSTVADGVDVAKVSFVAKMQRNGFDRPAEEMQETSTFQRDPAAGTDADKARKWQYIDAVIKNPFKNIRGDVVTPPRRAVTTTSRGVPNGNQN